MMGDLGVGDNEKPISNFLLQKRKALLVVYASRAASVKKTGYDQFEFMFEIEDYLDNYDYKDQLQSPQLEYYLAYHCKKLFGNCFSHTFPYNRTTGKLFVLSYAPTINRVGTPVCVCRLLGLVKSVNMRNGSVPDLRSIVPTGHPGASAKCNDMSLRRSLVSCQQMIGCVAVSIADCYRTPPVVILQKIMISNRIGYNQQRQQQQVGTLPPQPPSSSASACLPRPQMTSSNGYGLMKASLRQPMFQYRIPTPRLSLSTTSSSSPAAAAAASATTTTTNGVVNWYPTPTCNSSAGRKRSAHLDMTFLEPEEEEPPRPRPHQQQPTTSRTSVNNNKSNRVMKKNGRPPPMNCPVCGDPNFYIFCTRCFENTKPAPSQPSPSQLSGKNR